MAAAKQVSSSADFVTVACKLPTGFVLHLDAMEEYTEQVLGGGTRVSHRARRIGGTYTINGCAYKHGMTEPQPFVLAGGYALTNNIPADFWNEWLSQNRDSDLVRNKIVMAHEKHESAFSMAKDHAAVWSGLEPITPNTDKRIPRNIKTGDGKKAA